MRFRIAVTFLLTCLVSSVARAQSYTAAADLFFYGDNTEFANPFREGETLFGASGRVFLEIVLNDTVVVRGGLFGLGRFGSHEFLEHAEPMIALEVARGPSRFLFGSLDTAATRHDIVGPDYETPHGLLPPLQRETLAFTRGQEMGLQWLVPASRINHDLWINWQRLNTRSARERFDAGYRSAILLNPSLQLHGQWHLVHEGGQQFASGPVSDSQGVAVGLEWSHRAGAARIVLDGHPVLTRYVPNREMPTSAETGVGVFLRGALEQGPWRGHLIVWRSQDTLKVEGDPNYLAERLDGSVFHNVRDYGELGLTRHFRPAAGVHLFASVRLHRVESSYEYSYRIVGRVRLRHPF
jgi:hypothetical protein